MSALIASNGLAVGAVFTLHFQKLFNKDNDFIIDVNPLRLAFKLLLQQAIFPGDAREGAREKLSPVPRVSCL